MRRIYKRNADPQCARSGPECAGCGAELYRGCPCWRLGGGYWCEACLVRRVLAELAPFRVRWGEAAI